MEIILIQFYQSLCGCKVIIKYDMRGESQNAISKPDGGHREEEPSSCKCLKES